MSGKAMWQAVALDLPLTSNERVVLFTLAFYVRGDDKFCSPGKDKLRAKTGLSHHYLDQTLGLLQRDGLIEIKHRRDPHNKWKNSSSVYTLLFMEDWEKQKPKEEKYDIYAL